jgi:hypothetical protein
MQCRMRNRNTHVVLWGLQSFCVQIFGVGTCKTLLVPCFVCRNSGPPERHVTNLRRVDPTLLGCKNLFKTISLLNTIDLALQWNPAEEWIEKPVLSSANFQIFLSTYVSSFISLVLYYRYLRKLISGNVFSAILQTVLKGTMQYQN